MKHSSVPAAGGLYCEKSVFLDHSNILPFIGCGHRWKSDADSPADFFFRPSPSRLSPGRNTVFVPFERIVQCLAFSLIGVSKESMDQYTVQHVHMWWRQPGKRETAHQKSKQNHQTNTKQNKTTTKTHRHKDI